MSSGCGGFLTDGMTYNSESQTSEAASRLHRAAAERRLLSGARPVTAKVSQEGDLVGDEEYNTGVSS